MGSRPVDVTYCGKNVLLASVEAPRVSDLSPVPNQSRVPTVRQSTDIGYIACKADAPVGQDLMVCAAGDRAVGAR